MPAIIRIPTVLRPVVGGLTTVSTQCTTVGEALKELVADYPGVAPQIFDEQGGLHRFLNVYVNDDDVRYTGGLGTALADRDEVTLLPAVAGGAVE